MRPRLAAAGFALVTGILAGAGCNSGSDLLGFDFGASRDKGADDGSEASRAGGASAAARAALCGGDAGPAVAVPDPSTLPPCAPACAGARCVPAERIPEAARASFAACSGGFCIPESMIRSGGARPPSCASLGGKAGVCLSTCIPQVAEKEDILPRTGCAGAERCVPCIDPNDGTPTGACAIAIAPPSPAAPSASCVSPDAGSSARSATTSPSGTTTAPATLEDGPPRCPHVGPPVLDPSTLAPCGNAAHCLAADLVPAEMAGRLATCAGGRCVPDKLIATGGRFIPATCTSFAGAEGRCQSLALPEVAAQSTLPQASCDPTERCVPCFNPLDGADTGACRTSCDPGPAQPATSLRSCCEDDGALLGKCLPRASIPAGVSNLDDDGCFEGELCVPTEHLSPAFVPPRCHASSFFSSYDGVCLSDCFDIGLFGDLGTSQGSCSEHHTCVPCEAGIPGCQ